MAKIVQNDVFVNAYFLNGSCIPIGGECAHGGISIQHVRRNVAKYLKRYTPEIVIFSRKDPNSPLEDGAPGPRCNPSPQEVSIVVQDCNRKDANFWMVCLKSIHQASMTSLVEKAEFCDIVKDMEAYWEERDDQNMYIFEACLLKACSLGAVDIIEAILNRNPEIPLELNIRDANGHTPLTCASSEDYVTVVQSLLRAQADPSYLNRPGSDSLNLASYRGNIEVVKLLIEAKAKTENADVYGGTSLYWASRRGNHNLVKLLLDADAEIESTNIYGETSLCWACLLGCTKTVELLLEKGANVHHKNLAGDASLSWAARNGHQECCEILLSYGADVNHANNAGFIPLSLAARYGHTGVIKLLLNTNADAYHRNHDDDTPLLLAQRSFRMDVISLLQNSMEFDP